MAQARRKRLQGSAHGPRPKAATIEFGIQHARPRKVYLRRSIGLHFGSLAAPGSQRLHLQPESWEYYVEFRGTRVLQLGENLVEVHAGEVLEVPAGVKHALRTTIPPFEGFTFRAPRLDDKVEL